MEMMPLKISRLYQSLSSKKIQEVARVLHERDMLTPAFSLVLFLIYFRNAASSV